MRKTNSRQFKRNAISTAVALTLVLPLAINSARAGSGWGDNANLVDKVQTYYANSPSGLRAACFDANGLAATPMSGGLCDSGRALRKFVDSLPGLTAAGANNLGQYIPVAAAQKWVNAQGVTTADDYYELAAVEHEERMHSDLVKGTRLRGYVQLETPANAATSRHIALSYPDGTPILDGNGVQVFGYDHPHYLGPVIVATRGVAVRIKMTNYLPLESQASFFLPVDKTAQSAGVGPDGVTPYTDNRIAVHWHGGDAIWTSDGTAHQWFAPAGETVSYAAGMGKGAAAANVPDMPDPGAGAYTLYYPNNMSGRLMWYHDHASGITKLNAYAGVAAGYLIVDSTEAAMVAAGTLPAENIPLILQDKTFVPNDIAQQDAKWDMTHWGKPGDLWFPHVYETNQDPNSVDGTNPVGRWDWGPWFWPVFPAQYSLPSGDYGDATATPEAFMDTAMVNGTAYPTMTVEPKAYRLRILNGSNDRFLNLGFYVADTTSPEALAIQAATGVLGTEVPMVPFVAGGAAFPTTGGLMGTGWGTPVSMMHAAGVPDPAAIGPAIVQIGTEGGFLPNAVTIPSTPINFEYNKRSITVLGVLEHGLFLGAAERADAVVDFAPFAGKTLILYNDAPAPLPAGDPRIDYYTNGPDNTGAGGAGSPLPGYGPNTRTMLRVVVASAVTTPSTFKGIAALVGALPPAYAAAQEPPIIPESAYNLAFGTSNADNYMKISTGALTQPTVNFTPSGAQSITSVTLVGGGTGYLTMPAVVFTPPAGAAGAGATAVVGAGIGGVVLTSAGAGYKTAPTVVFSGGTLPDGTPVNWAANPGYAAATASVIQNALTKLYTVTGITVTKAGSFKTMPNVAFVGGTPTKVATATVKTTGQLNSITLTSAGAAYTAAPTISFVGGGGIGATAAVKTSLTTTLPVLNKGIQELFDPVYGRMNATFSIELPFTSAVTQTTVPLAYLDPATETITDGETQIWKITHNGVDSHPVHFHLVNVQVINRVGWDGTIKPPRDNELGWKETVRMNPLEDIYVAARAKKPVTPGFGLPESVRLRDPSQLQGSTLGFSQFDFTGSPVAGSANFNPNFGKTVPAGTVFNDYENFDNEYVWHCHILGHEEFDFMRPITFHPFKQDASGQWVVPGTTISAIPAAPLSVSATIGAAGVTLAWVDSSTTEYQFRIERATVSNGLVSAYVVLATALANATGYIDVTAVAGAGYAYRVVAVGAKGEGVSAVVSTAPPVVVNAPTALAAVATSPATASLSWNDNAVNETEYLVSVNGAAPLAIARNAAQGAATGVVSVTVPIAGPGTYTFAVTAVNVSGGVTTASTVASLTSAFAAPAVPAAPTAAAVTSSGLTLNWTAVTGATAYTVYQNGVQVATVPGNTRAMTGLTASTAYTYTVTANNVVGASAQSTALNVTTPAATVAIPATPRAPTATRGARGSLSATVTWRAATRATTYTVQIASSINGRNWSVPVNVAVGVTALTYTATGLTAGTQYRFAIIATNAGGSSAASPASGPVTAR